MVKPKCYGWMYMTGLRTRGKKIIEAFHLSGFRVVNNFRARPSESKVQGSSPDFVTACMNWPSLDSSTPPCFVYT